MCNLMLLTYVISMLLLQTNELCPAVELCGNAELHHLFGNYHTICPNYIESSKNKYSQWPILNELFIFVAWFIQNKNKKGEMQI